MNTMMAREKDQGGRAAVRSLVEKLGFTSAAALEEHLTSLRQAEQEQLTETERREQAVAVREKAAIDREAAALARERDALHRSALVTAGVTSRDLDGAVALLRVPNDADADALGEAVQELSGRRPELFNAPAQGMPPAPGGAPASVPPPRPGSAERKPGAAGLEMARRRGLLPDPN
ncbi:hypothetical protein AB0B50_04130 [Streptomyces sp. NPDC041068]|uniref:hypothetical protein n=1 Tax=Streptomyces sp. NPDC041068 TaxID=3155130 RepID=UPI00340520D2